MSGKQMEGDNPRRRARATRAREEGRTSSARGTTLGASKQREYETGKRRAGPPPAGTHKPVPDDPAEGRPARPTRPWPKSRPAQPTGETESAGRGRFRQASSAGVQYRELVAAASAQTGLPFDQGRRAAEATITVLARALGPADRERMLARVPTELHDDHPTAQPGQPADLADFLGQVAQLAQRTPEQARHEAQAVLSAVREQDPGLLELITLPQYVGDLLAPPPVGGGVVAPGGGTPPLSEGELRDALGKLRRWSGDRRALTRTISLPPENLDLVLRRLADLKPQLGRGPEISRDGDGSATLTVSTVSARAVTAADVELARRIDTVIDEAGAGMNYG